MKNKKINIFLFICLTIFLAINSMAIGVNDSTNYVSKSEFNTALNAINTRISEIDIIIEQKINDYFSNITPMYEAGTGINLTKNVQNNKWTMSVAQLTTSVISGPGNAIVTTSNYQDVISTTLTHNSLVGCVARISARSGTSDTIQRFKLKTPDFQLAIPLYALLSVATNSGGPTVTFPTMAVAAGDTVTLSVSQFSPVACTVTANSCTLYITPIQ
ncbi:MAG: hypothetical protein Q4F88_06590 [Eubacteriales bacterium]|nr:hypothetical protein [Eubacteriales bacterium]